MRNITTLRLVAALSGSLMIMGIVALGAIRHYNTETVKFWWSLGRDAEPVSGMVIAGVGVATTIAMFFCAAAVMMWIGVVNERGIRRKEQEYANN